jgi:RNA polymerase I-specific transcription initiation factor RRN5
MEDAEVLDDIGLHTRHVDEDSGSAYEESSSDASLSSSHYERLQGSRPSSTTSQRERGRSRNRKSISRSTSRGGRPRERSVSPPTKEKLHADASRWASTFQEPQISEDIKSPTRHTAGTQSKRKAEQPASQIRAKRLKGLYNNGHRELLNSVIHEAASRSILDEYPSLPGSQIGSSVWTGEEKDAFFTALSRLGRHDSRGIALRIGSKSEFEVQEYIQLLHQGLKDREDLHQPLFDLTKLPAACEISEECSDLLERAGDALASRQECSEEEAEKGKWGDFWLLTTDICKSIESQRKEFGEQRITESLPTANFLDLKNWLELSRTIFMNSAGPLEDNNWQSFAEPGETPAIRATAFEDFHALAVSVTKRLISTTLFCTMSRRQAIHAIGIKHAEVTLDDVEAAVKILGLKQSSFDFWIGSARKHSLTVFDFDADAGHDVDLTYDEVETALRETRRRSRSRSRSMSRQPFSRKSAAGSVDGGTDRDVATDSIAESPETDDSSMYDQESDLISSSSPDDDELVDLSEGQVMSRNSRAQESRRRKAEELKKAVRAHEAYIEAYDLEASQVEENRLRKLFRQSSPLEIKPEPLEMPDQPKHSRNAAAEVDWRDSIEYWSPWETLQTQVPEESFANNRKRMSRRARRRIREDSSRRDLSSEDGEASSDDAARREISTESDDMQEKETGQGGHADVQMKDEDNADPNSASQSDKESS